jgi:hypothetical protein
MRWRIATLRAAAISVAAFLIAGCVSVLQAALRFDGTCGGLIPFLAAAQRCTRWQYVWSDVSFTFEVLLREYWVIGLLFVGIVFVGSAIFERFWSRPNAV